MKQISNENYYNADGPFNYFGIQDSQTGEFQKITESYLIELIEVSKALFGITRLPLSSMIDRLSKRNIIDREQKSRFHNLRQIRNMQAHPSFQTQLGLPTYDVLKDICTEIDSLFHAIHNHDK
ncbi:DUF4145 domain-containing protein [Paenibacillus sp. TC-CSREp1]|uniref:DUF4145 domain-containing protein n=1 Tax=Paenibacillus sp. TC-CSREp1 TaxID=3410089 RepID=UPI003CFB8D60